MTALIGFSALAIDLGHLYVGHSYHDKIEYLLPDGSVHGFSAFPYNIGGSPNGIAFAPETNFGGKMYVGVIGEGTWAGIFSLDTNGNPEN